MSSKSFRRYFLRDKETRSFIQYFMERFKVSLDELLKTSRFRIEIVEVDKDLKIFLVDGKPMLVRLGEAFFPCLKFNKLLSFIPRVVVDMGAVSHVCNGADIMAPGIVRVEGNFQAHDIVAVVDEQHSKVLAVGEALCNSEEIRSMRRGKVIKNLHYVGDKIWKQLKLLTK
jgi:PUA domain protein